jgi:molybdate transport system substrate-binding protein
MGRIAFAAGVGISTAGGLLLSSLVQAAEIKVLASVGLKAALSELAPQYERTTGNKLSLGYSLVADIRKRVLEGGETADVIILSRPVMDELQKQDKLTPGSIADVAALAVGVAARTGAPKPDISTVEGFKQAMLNAKSIGHSNNGTGPFNTKLFQKLGIYDQIKDKIKIIEGRPVATAVAAGDVEIGLQQTNVIQPVAGTEYLGPLPAELMEYGRFSLGVMTVSKEPEAAKAFIKFATSPDAAPLIRKSAMETPAK